MSRGSAAAVPERESLLHHGEKAAELREGAGGFRLCLFAVPCGWLRLGAPRPVTIPAPVTFITPGALRKEKHGFSFAKPRESTTLPASANSVPVTQKLRPRLPGFTSATWLASGFADPELKSK